MPNRFSGCVIHGLSVSYETENEPVPAVRGVDLTLHPGETIGLVGESGSGKTTLALGAIGYLPANGRIVAGETLFGEVDLLRLSRKRLGRIWGLRVGFVSQDPQTALNPTLTIGRQLDEMARRHLRCGRRECRQRSLHMLRQVDMPNPEAVLGDYPHQLSGGMLQRAAIAMALVTHPDLLILDEPTTGLDVTTQALVLDLLDQIKAQSHSAILYITHNLGVVAHFCDRVAVMYAGEVFEEADTSDLFSLPLHPYTANLLNCVPRLTADEKGLATIPGELPKSADLPPGCVFAPRCPLALDICRGGRPPLVEVSPGRFTACLRWRVLQGPEGQAAAVRREHEVERASARPRARTTGAQPAGDGSAGGDGARASRPLVELEDAGKEFISSRGRVRIRAVDDTRMAIPRSQTLGLVGESGSGKTTLARIVTGLTAPTEGRVLLEGLPLAATATKRSRATLRRLQMVFQSPEASLNPRRTAGEAISRPLILLRGLTPSEAREQTLALLQAVRLPSSYHDRYPFELSGGEKQRVAVARAFATGPDLVACDEPLSSLDVSVQGSIMNLLVDFQNDFGTSYLFISHDLAAVHHLSHLIGVLYLGRLMEQGEAALVLAPPHHPYTEALLSAVPVPDPALRRPRVRLRGDPPSSEHIPAGCRFHPRCPRYLGDICRLREPPWRLHDGAVIETQTAPGDDSRRKHADEAAAAARHAIYCHIPLDKLSELQGVG